MSGGAAVYGGLRQTATILRHLGLHRRACLAKAAQAARRACRFPQPHLAVIMKNKKNVSPRRVAISLDLNWGYKRHLEVFAGCQKYADEAGWDCSINPVADHMLKRGQGTRCDGVIARATTQLAQAARQAGVPVVNVWMNSPTQGLPSVFADFEASGVMAAEHLLARGFRKFGYLGFLRDIDSRRQLHGFRNVVRDRGFSCTVQRVSRNCDDGSARAWEEFVTSLEKWIDTWELPIGIFVCQDLFCRFLIDVCRAKGLHVSQDVAIVGTHNESEICGAPSPSLTSIDLGFGQVGYRAAAMLDRLMAGGAAPVEPELVPPAELVPRQSTDAYAASDPLVARAMRFIAENGHRRIQVKHVAAAVATTRRTLERRFREAMGRSIAGEITRMRLQRAKRRMVETDAAMKDVAIEAGFRTADHFGKVFTRIEGVSPSIYREGRQKAFPQRI
jgi:LacI family transcriptional regulator